MIEKQNRNKISQAPRFEIQEKDSRSQHEMIQNRQYNFHISWKNTESYCPPTSYKNNRSPMIQARYTLPLSEGNIWVIQENEKQSPVSDKSLNSTSQGKFWSEEFFPASDMLLPRTLGYPRARNCPLPWEQHRALVEQAEHGQESSEQWLRLDKRSPGRRLNILDEGCKSLARDPHDPQGSWRPHLIHPLNSLPLPDFLCLFLDSGAAA